MDAVDNYFSDCSKAFRSFDDFFASFKNENYKTVAKYVSSSDGNTYRAITVENSTGKAFRFSQILEYNKGIIDAIKQTGSVFTVLGISKGTANLGLVELGLRGIEYRKYIKNFEKVTKAYKERLDKIVEEKEAENKLIESMIQYGLTVDGRASDDNVIFVP